ncbi:helix-turn-helix domain-containing protein [Actinokineospora soli]|uniref:Helix-turn-helix domain-containing protein n=1 Tax=Actinokineospora soli TaxID=1048753 RepID=A0ABW2TUA3_9PSEU
MDGFGAAVKAMRGRLSPRDAGLPAGTGRRAPGLRREELARLAGISVDYLVRLEQGRATAPSAQVVAAVARALQARRPERDHLFRLAGLLPPPDGLVGDHVPPGVARIVARMGEAALAVFAADWSVITWNPLWAALLGEPGERNLLRVVFGSQALVATGAGFEAALVADLRRTAARYPRDPRVAELVADLRRGSARFAELWASGAVGEHASDRKTVDHSAVGPIELDCDVLTVPGDDLRVVVYTAASGTPDAEALASLSRSARSGSAGSSVPPR